ncbi:hypothetical protein FEDK69T_21610 [Flavobacterium enshiense DK69]|uniref:Glycosyltransferase 2-like domain-containing protein n=1 Tax=Flavobacterium enshiense DK69 TaxID=1107311 RepID=V6S6C7_9FLAO|nr:glycosyltransferase family A protein [Flavobacterium enshiense]ESU22181.1 hypothetical protein FEDK69T_21610 [Flavobacterium enshiense DK69]KGO97193.1 hypothetical protein Q767_00895 [Flavobacterium enshiense DK69]
MRVGFNPQKDKELEENSFFHQIIIPVYIPNEKDYFRDSLSILKLCVSSLKKTTHNKTFFTIVNNGSCEEVISYLDDLYHKKIINEIIHTSKIGKLNAILKGLGGHNFELVTIADADALFLNGWQNETYEVFKNFPKAGAVSPLPNPKMVRYLTSNILMENIFSKKLFFSNVKNPLALKKFAKSIDNVGLFNEFNLDKYLTVQNNSFKAVVGSGHFVATYRGEIFNTLKKYSGFSMGGDSERVFLDEPTIKNGFWRLSTLDNYVYHMGNTKEDWMELEVESAFYDTKNNDNFIVVKGIKDKNVVNWLKFKLVPKILFKKGIWQLFLRYKGLSKEEASNY